ncbi:unnamed protein product [Hanseniaspora opuntiae]
MNNTTVFDITKVSIETYDAKTKQKEWNHLSNLNPNVQYEMKVVVEQTNLVFQICNKANKQDMHLNLKVKCQIHPETKRPYVSSATLRMIIKPPIIAFRYNIKDLVNNEIILKKAQFVNEEAFLPQQNYNSLNKNIYNKDFNNPNQEQSSQRNHQDFNVNAYTAKNNIGTVNGPNFSYAPQHPESLSRRCSFYEVPVDQIYNTQRRNSVLVPILPQNDIPSNVDNKGKVMEKEDIENMMTSVLNNVLPKISDLQKASTKDSPMECKDVSVEVKAPEINTKNVVKNVDGLSLDFFLCLDNETKIGILKNLGFFQALKLISGCDDNTQRMLHDLIKKELGVPIKIDSILKANDYSHFALKDLNTSEQYNAKERDDTNAANPKKSAKSKKQVLDKTPSTPKKVNKPRRNALSPSTVLKELETWEKIDEDTVEGAIIGKRFLRKPRKSRLPSMFEQKDTVDYAEVSCNETLVNQERLSYGLKVSKEINPNLGKNAETNTLKCQNDLNQRNMTLDKTTEVITGNSYMNDIGDSSSLVEDEVFNNHTKYKKSHELLR